MVSITKTSPLLHVPIQLDVSSLFEITLFSLVY